MAEERKSNEQDSTQNGDKNSNGKTPFWKKRPVIFIGIAAMLVLFYFGLHHLFLSFTHESTDNAFLDADIVAVAPKISGQVKTVHIEDNQVVKAGDLLVEIDPRDYETALAAKKSALVAAQANVDVIKASFELLAAQVTTAEAVAKQSEAEAAADQAKADKASADLKRAEDLSQRKIISPQEYDAAKAAADAALATLKASQQKTLSDKSKVTSAEAEYEAGRKTYDRAAAQSQQSGVDVQQAELNLSYARITAPADGRITRKAVEPGDYVQVGQKLTALVLTNIWVTANFKETQLQNIRTNQPVVITVDSVGGRKFSGHVQSIQAGSGAAFSLLPPENAVGNYVKVVQRVPVKIVFDNPIEAGHVLGPGMSVVPAVRVKNFEVPDFVVGIIAIALAVGVGAFWWRAANKK
jgi:membrane fusion protein (multidrug efflux system)